MTEQRDIVVIGAGPAGSMAAREAARAGLRPLLIERAPTPGARKACGGAAAYAFRELLALPPEVVECGMHRARLRLGAETVEVVGRRPLYASFHRAAFDAYLAERAVQAGAELWTSTRATAVDPASGRIALRDLATRREREVAARILIFADGPRTLALPAFGIGHRGDHAPASAAYVELDGDAAEPDVMELIAEPALQPPGYFWVFPKRGRVQVGVGEPRVARGESLWRHLERFVEARPDLRGRAVVARNAGLVPTERAREFVADRAMVAGDAAGLVNPLTGEGICYALVSGTLAGRVAARALQAGRTDRAALSAYPRRLRRTLAYLWHEWLTRRCRQVEQLGPSRWPEAYHQLLLRYFRRLRAMPWIVGFLARHGGPVAK